MNSVIRRYLVGLVCVLAVFHVNAADPPPVAPHVSMSFADLANGDILVTVTANTMAGWESLHFTTVPLDNNDGLPAGGRITDDDPVGDWVLTQNTIALSGPANNARDTITFTIVYGKNNVAKSTKTLTFVPDDQGTFFPPATPYEVTYPTQQDPTIKSLAAVPEPSSVALMILGFAALAYRSQPKTLRTSRTRSLSGADLGSVDLRRTGPA